MREIEFRAWNPQEKRMINNVPIDENGKYRHCISTGFALQYDPSYVTLEVMQFTGLYDKNNVKIFEGDIIKYTYGIHKSNENISVVELIEYDDAEQYNVVKHFGWYAGRTLPDIINDGYGLVIGNIHENPGLLKR